MKKYITTFSILVCLMLMQTSITSAQMSNIDSWKQFRGPDRNGIAGTLDLPEDIPATGPKLLWKAEIGSGFSELSIEGDKIYTMLSEQTDSLAGIEYVASYNATNGKLLWKTQIDSLFFDEFGNGPRSTPLVGEKYIYSFSSYGKLTANAKEDGKTIWQIDFMAEYGSALPRWGFSTSPLLLGNTLIMEAGGTESRGFMGFDAETGKVKWSFGDAVAYYSSPVVANIDGIESVIFANQTTLFAFNREGDTLWTHPMTMNGPMASPVFFDGNKIFVSTVRSDGFSVMEVKDRRVTDILNASTMQNDFSSSLYHDGYIYGFNIAALQCISAETGEKKWSKRGLGKGSVILVGDKLLALSDKGRMVIAKATPEAYTELASFQALEGKSWTAPSFAGGKLYVRNLTEMACYEF